MSGGRNSNLMPDFSNPTQSTTTLLLQHIPVSPKQDPLYHVPSVLVELRSQEPSSSISPHLQQKINNFFAENGFCLPESEKEFSVNQEHLESSRLG